MYFLIEENHILVTLCESTQDNTIHYLHSHFKTAATVSEVNEYHTLMLHTFAANRLFAIVMLVCSQHCSKAKNNIIYSRR